MNKAYTYPSPRCQVSNGYSFLFLMTIFFLQAVHICVLACCFYPMETSTLITSGLVSILIYSLLIRAEYFSSEFGVTPFMLYLFLGLIRLGVIPVYVAFAVDLGHSKELLFAGHDTSPHFVAGHFINLFGDCFFVSGYIFLKKCLRRKVPLIEGGTLVNPTLIVRGAFFLLFVVYVSRVAVLVGIPLTALGQPYAFFASYGVAAAILMLLFAIQKSSPSQRHKLLIIFCIVFIAELAILSRSYMKQPIIVAVFPLFLFAVIKLRHIAWQHRSWKFYRRLVMLGILAMFSISVLFTYSQLRRPDQWAASRSNPWEAKRRVDVLSYLLRAVEASIPGTTEFAQVQEFPDKGFWYFFSRNNFVNASGWLFDYVNRKGTNDGKFIREAPAVLVPRVLWPGKPMVAHGRDLAIILGQAKSWETATTSTGLTMAGCFYFAWGWPAVVVGMFLNGILFCLAWRVYSSRIIVNPIATLICISLFIQGGIRWFSASFDGNFVYYILIFGCFLPLSILVDKCLPKYNRGYRERINL